MALDAIRSTLDGLSDDVKEHYTEKDGKFFLNVTKVEGLALENVDGLKSTVEKLRASEKILNAEVKAAEDALKELQRKHKEFQSQYDGIDAEQAKSALSKIDEIKNWDGETKVREAVAVTEQKIKQEMDAKLKDLVKQHTTESEKLQNDLADSQSQLQEAIVVSRIVEAISKEGGNVDVLMPHVKNQVRMSKDSRGTWRPEVVNKEGNPRIGGSDGQDMTILQLVQEMKVQDTFASCFSGVNSTGSGANTHSDTGSNKKSSKSKVIAASDKQALSSSLEDIASGKTEVDMSR